MNGGNADESVLTAELTGNPAGGQYDDPWSTGHPAEGERVALFVFEVTNVDGDAENVRTYHVAPVEQATSGPVGPGSGAAQGVRAHWAGCGTATVVRLVPGDGDDRRCDVVPDDPASC